MLVAGFKNSEHTTSLIMQLYSATGKSELASRLLAQISDHNITPYIFCSALGACKSVQEALSIFKRAKRLRKLDNAVYTSLSKVLAQNGLFDEASAYIDEMIQEGYGLSKISMSFIVSLCVESFSVNSAKGASMLIKYLSIAYANYTEVFTYGLCQTVVQRLLDLNEAELACQLHLRYFSTLSCKSETLLQLFTQLQSKAESTKYNTLSAELESQVSVGRKALGLLGLYCRPNKDKKSNEIYEREKVIKSAHFNNVLRILSLAKMYNESEGLFHLMSGYELGAEKTEDQVRGSEVKIDPVTRKRSHSWKPGIFTIAELIRAARISNKPELALRVIRWAFLEGTPLPVAVLSDSISFAYE